MAKARDDDNGWKRGVGHYSTNYAKFDQPVVKGGNHLLEAKVMSAANTDRPGAVSHGGPPRHKAKTASITYGTALRSK